MDADRRDRVVIRVADADGTEVATILFKGRDELPDYPLLHGRGTVRHLGEPPRFLAGDSDCAEAYMVWTSGFAEGDGVPHFVVDATPLGVALLADELSGQGKWQGLAREMRNGVWSPSVLEIADALVAETCVEPGSEGLIAEVRARAAEHRVRQLDHTAIALDALLAGEMAPQLAALEQTAPAWHTRTAPHLQRADARIADPLREYWRGRIEALRAEHKLEMLPAEIAAATGSEVALPSAVRYSIEQVLLLARERLRTPETRDDQSFDWDWARDNGPAQWFTEARDPFRILMVARALAGDAQAALHVRSALDALVAHDEWRTDQAATTRHGIRLDLGMKLLGGGEQTAMTPDELVVVHATSFAPTRSPDGAVQLLTRFDSTGFPRASLHFTLNHVVTSHMYGSWDDAGYLVIAPLAPAIAANGVPTNLLGVDTWWERNPGAPVALPDAVVLRLDPNVRDLISRTGNDVVIKGDNFTETDIEELAYEGVLRLDDLETRVADMLRAFPGRFGDGTALRTSIIAMAARDLAARRVMADFGVRSTEGGMWSTGIDLEVGRLGFELGTTGGPHEGSGARLAESTASRILSADDARAGGTLAMVGPEARRVAIAAGMAAPVADRAVQRTSATHAIF